MEISGHVLLLIVAIVAFFLIILIIFKSVFWFSNEHKIIDSLNSQILDVSTSALFITDINGIIQMVNKTALKMFKYNRYELVGSSINKLMPETIASMHDTLMQTYLKNEYKYQLNVSLREIYALRSNGEEFPIQIQINEIWYNDTRYFVGAISDISAEKQAIKESIKSEKDSANKDKFLSLLSHDLRTPVGKIQSLSEILIEDMESMDKTEVSEIIQNIYDVSESALYLISSLLSSQRIKGGDIDLKLKNVDIVQFIKTTLSEFKNLYKLKNITLKESLPEKPIFCEIDELLINQVIINLLTNAEKFCQKGDEIAISVYKKGSDYALICVEDSGPGIPPEDIFELFQYKELEKSTGSNGEIGTGFGLPFCHEIITSHGGRILAGSSNLGGAKIEIYLKISE
ncbi:MAG: PAS domain-containing sensor histidine kinase [Halobacteriovoraceae bacterium]|nr:PAS domain-containing sensor histidine kinase [Halobacteriovoraceae bacterium]